MKHKLTPAQLEARKERQAKFRELVKQVANMPDEQRVALAEKIMVTTVEGHTLSLTNQHLIALQLESATLVGGFRQWIKTGRCVRKGEHGLMIWIPKGKKEDDGKEPGEISMKDLESPGFFMGTVFDISQTVELEA